MDTRAVIQMLQAASQRDAATMLSSTGGPSWLGKSSSLQPQVTQAIHTWLYKDDPQPILGVIELLHTVGALSAAEVTELRSAIE